MENVNLIKAKFLMSSSIDDNDEVIIRTFIVSSANGVKAGDWVYDTNAERFVQVIYIQKNTYMLTCKDGEEEFLMPYHDCKSIIAKDDEIGVIYGHSITSPDGVVYAPLNDNYIEHILNNDGWTYVQVEDSLVQQKNGNNVTAHRLKYHDKKVIMHLQVHPDFKLIASTFINKSQQSIDDD